jgi:hypothetical protein
VQELPLLVLSPRRLRDDRARHPGRARTGQRPTRPAAGGALAGKAAPCESWPYAARARRWQGPHPAPRPQLPRCRFHPGLFRRVGVTLAHGTKVGWSCCKALLEGAPGCRALSHHAEDKATTGLLSLFGRDKVANEGFTRASQGQEGSTAVRPRPPRCRVGAASPRGARPRAQMAPRARPGASGLRNAPRARRGAGSLRPAQRPSRAARHAERPAC